MGLKQRFRALIAPCLVGAAAGISLYYLSIDYYQRTRPTNAAQVTATIKDSVAVSQNTFIFRIPVNINDNKVAQAAAFFTVRANASYVTFNLELSVNPDNLDSFHKVYLATSERGFQVPFEVRLINHLGSINPAAGQIAEGVSGVDLIGTQYEITLTEATHLKALYVNSPPDIYTISIDCKLQQTGNGQKSAFLKCKMAPKGML